jgi:WD40 repeat protein/tRNA A-37 threonylcarbamoyl transferase component Bud32
MAIATVADLLAALRSYRQLAPEQLDALAREALPADVRAAARNLVQRGWLTTYQINELFLGRGRHLLLGSYVLLELLGEGGMGQVFKARNWKLGQIVALKLIRQERLANADAVKRFYREIRAAAQLDHPNIVRAFDADEAGGTHFFVMEFVEGTDLYELVKAQGPLEVRRACNYARQAALGLQQAHERGLVHRDIKPHNLLLVSGAVAGSGSSATLLTTPQVKILDLGLARIDAEADDGHSSTMTQQGTLMGTPDYIAPEQSMDAHAVDIRADLYSLGCTLYFLLAGQTPFAGGTFIEKLLKHQQQRATPLRELRSDVPLEVEAVVAKLMAKRAEDRYQTPAELAQALEAVLTGSMTTLPSGIAAAAPAATTVAAPNVFAELSPSDTAALVAALIQPKTAPGTGDNRVLKFGLLAAGGVLTMILLTVAVAWFFGPTRQPPDSVVGQGKARTPSEIAAEEEREHQEQEQKRQAEATEFQKTRQAEAEGALAKLAIKAAKQQLTFVELAREVQAFKGTYGGTPAANKAVEMLMKLPSPLDQLDPKKLPDDAKAAWKATGSDVLKELVAVLGSHQRRHWGPVTAVGFGSDGAVDSLGSDGIVRRWNPNTGIEQLISVYRSLPAYLARFSPDGKLVAFHGGHLDPQIRLVDVATGKERPPLEGMVGPQWTNFAFSWNGRTLVGVEYGTATEGEYKNRTLLMSWDLATGKKKHALVIPIGWPSGHPVAITDDGQTVFVSLTATRTDNAQKGAVKRIALGTGKEQILESENGSPYLALSPDEQTLALASSGGQIILWDTTQNKERVTFAGAGPVAFSMNGRLLATSDGKLVEVATGEVRASLRGGGVPAFSRDGKHLAVGGTDGVIRLWDVDTGEEVQPLGDDIGPLWSLAFASQGRLVMTGQNRIVAKDPVTGQTLWRRPTDGLLAENHVASSPSEGMALFGFGDSACLVDQDSGRVAAFLAHPGTQVFGTAFSPDGRLALTACADKTVRVWDIAARQEIRRFEGHANEVYDVAVAPDGRTALSISEDGARLWEIETCRELRRFEQSRGGRSVGFAPGGGRAVSAHPDGLVRIQSLSDASAPVVLKGHASGIVRADFAPDGKLLASAGSDGHLVLWDATSGQRLDRWQLPGPVHHVAFAADGRHLATANGNGTAYILRLDPKDLLLPKALSGAEAAAGRRRQAARHPGRDHQQHRHEAEPDPFRPIRHGLVGGRSRAAR